MRSTQSVMKISIACKMLKTFPTHQLRGLMACSFSIVDSHTTMELRRLAFHDTAISCKEHCLVAFGWIVFCFPEGTIGLDASKVWTTRGIIKF